MQYVLHLLPLRISQESRIEYCRNSLGMQKICDLAPDMVICLGTELGVFFQQPKINQKQLRGRVIPYTLPSGRGLSGLYSKSPLPTGDTRYLFSVKGDIVELPDSKGLQMKPVDPSSSEILTIYLGLWT